MDAIWYNYDLSPLTSSSTAEKTSRPLFLWTPQRYDPESLWVKLVMVTVNLLDTVSSVSLNCLLRLLSEVITACCRHVEGLVPLQTYFMLVRSLDSYGQVKDAEPVSKLWTLVDRSQQVSVSKIRKSSSKLYTQSFISLIDLLIDWFILVPGTTFTLTSSHKRSTPTLVTIHEYLPASTRSRLEMVTVKMCFCVSSWMEYLSLFSSVVLITISSSLRQSFLHRYFSYESYPSS